MSRLLYDFELVRYVYGIKSAYILLAIAVATPTNATAAGYSYLLGIGYNTCEQMTKDDAGITFTTEWAQGYVSGFDQALMLSRKEPSGGRFIGVEGAVTQFHMAKAVIAGFCKEHPDKSVWDAALNLWATLYKDNHHTP